VPTAVGVARLPDSVDFAEGAALGLAGAAALGAVDAAGPGAGTTVLVAGATGGVGTQAVQLAATGGAVVIATASTDEERELVTSLGAAETVDYRGDVAAAVRATRPDGVDVVLHFAGDPVGLLPAVRSGGRFVSTLIGSPDQVPGDGLTVVPISAAADAGTLDRIASSHVSGATRVAVQQVYALEQAASALADFGRGTLGKLVVTTD